MNYPDLPELSENIPEEVRDAIVKTRARYRMHAEISQDSKTPTQSYTVRPKSPFNTSYIIESVANELANSIKMQDAFRKFISAHYSLIDGNLSLAKCNAVIRGSNITLNASETRFVLAFYDFQNASPTHLADMYTSFSSHMSDLTTCIEMVEDLLKHASLKSTRNTIESSE